MLEASAGTGKTYTIAALAARYVAEGTPLDELLLVTFTRMATGELRERVRERLVAVEAGLLRALAGVRRGGDEVVALLAGARPTSCERAATTSRARSPNFDAATIATTHGFCQEVLGGLGFAGDLEAGTSSPRTRATSRRGRRRPLRAPLPRPRRAAVRPREALRIARAAIANPTAPIEPATRRRTRSARCGVRLADAVREELEARKQRGAVMTYDDLVDAAATTR